MPTVSVTPTQPACKFCGTTNTEKVFQLEYSYVCTDCILEVVQCMSCPTWGKHTDFNFTDHGFLCQACSTPVVCPNCGATHIGESLRTVDDIQYCISCVPPHNGCNVCGKMTQHKIGTERKKVVCLTCQEHYGVCGGCHSLSEKRNIVTESIIINGKEYTITMCACCSSKRKCQTCGKQKRMRDNMGYIFADLWVIPPRYASRVVSKTKMCFECASQQPKPMIAVGGYQHNHDISHSDFQPKYSSKALFYGIELEQECKNEQDSATESCTFIIDAMPPEVLLDVKRDGSLNNGHESVTYPMTWDYFKKQEESFKKFFENPHVREKWDSQQVGMHVHMSLGGFSTTQLYKFCQFMYSCNYVVELIGGRGATSYCARPTNSKWAKYKAKLAVYNQGRLNDKLKRKHSKIGLESFSRYDRINLTKRTAEARFFLTPNNFEQFMYRMEFLESLYQYSKNTPLSAYSGLGWYDFVMASGKAYPYLHSYLIGLTESQLTRVRASLAEFAPVIKS